MAIAGRVAIVPKGDWRADATYKRLDAVTYNNTLYFAKKEVPAGTATSNTEYWSRSIVGGAGAIATEEDAGIVKPADGLTVAEDGTLKVSIDGTTLTMDQVNNVIRLADTLKDKINGAFPAANLINNLTTTEAGFGLDARQGKALDDKITEINGSLENLNNFTDIPSNSDLNDIKFFNVGKYCCSFNVVAETVLNSPFATAFTMEVFYSSGTPNYIAQKAIEFASGHCKWRMRESGSGIIVQDWIQLY